VLYMYACVHAWMYHVCTPMCGFGITKQLYVQMRGVLEQNPRAYKFKLFWDRIAFNFTLPLGCRCLIDGQDGGTTIFWQYYQVMTHS